MHLIVPVILIPVSMSFIVRWWKIWCDFKKDVKGFKRVVIAISCLFGWFVSMFLAIVLIYSIFISIVVLLGDPHQIVVHSMNN